MPKSIGAHGWGIILIAGWLLMRPPLVRDTQALDGYRVLSGLPVSRWVPVSSYPSPGRCEAAREENYASAITKVRGAHRNIRDVSRFPLVKQALFAQCVPADQMYPPNDAGG